MIPVLAFPETTAAIIAPATMVIQVTTVAATILDIRVPRVIPAADTAAEVAVAAATDEKA